MQDRRAASLRDLLPVLSIALGVWAALLAVGAVVLAATPMRPGAFSWPDAVVGAALVAGAGSVGVGLPWAGVVWLLQRRTWRLRGSSPLVCAGLVAGLITLGAGVGAALCIARPPVAQISD